MVVIILIIKVSDFTRNIVPNIDVIWPPVYGAPAINLLIDDSHFFARDRKHQRHVIANEPRLGYKFWRTLRKLIFHFLSN